MAEGERAAMGVAAALRVGGGENNEGLGGSLGAQPANDSASIRRANITALARGLSGVTNK
jgi:hypothetical protein